MADIAPSFVQVHPNYTHPEILMQYTQASGAFSTLSEGKPQVRLGDNALYAYIKALDIRTKNQVGQSAANQLPGVSLAFRMISTPTYLIRNRAEYDHHDQNAVGNWGVSLVEAQRLGMRQATFQQLRNMLLYGMNPSNGEGLLNANGATALNLPVDPFGNSTILTYDNGAMAFFLLQQIAAAKTRMMQLGLSSRIVVLGPQRTLSSFEYQGIVQLTQYQRQGAGSNSVRGTVEDIVAMNGDSIEWVYDDTLIGKGAGGNDAVILVIPEIEKPDVPGANTNEFAKLTPGLHACTIQFTDMAAPREIPTPLPGGAIDVVSELRATCGWAPRPEAVTIVSMQYQ